MAKKEVVVKDSKEKKEAASEFQAGEFLQDTKEELAKVVWPSRQQVLGESTAVIFMVTLVATVIYLVDNFFSWLAKQPFLFG